MIHLYLFFNCIMSQIWKTNKNCCIYGCKIIDNNKNAFSLYLAMFIYIITLVKHHRHCLLISPSCCQSLKPSQQCTHNFLFHSSKNHHTNTNSVSWFYVQLCQLTSCSAISSIILRLVPGIPSCCLPTWGLLTGWCLS